MFSISDLLSLDAGRVISHTAYNPKNSQVDPKISAYYAQLYALVRFLREYEYGRYLHAFQTMLKHAYLGRWPLSDKLKSQTLRKSKPTRLWNAAVGKIIFQAYIAPTPDQIEPQYRAFCSHIHSTARFKKTK